MSDRERALVEAIKEHRRGAPKRLPADSLPIGGEVYPVESTRRDDKLYAALEAAQQGEDGWFRAEWIQCPYRIWWDGSIWYCVRKAGHKGRHRKASPDERERCK